ncbi:hypothetical protein SAMN05216345_11135 [Cupriavidus sp. YR651]|nr:hypothetical protein SAMN05216345_11135 [Cupriavidus sp. YR651]
MYLNQQASRDLVRGAWIHDPGSDIRTLCCKGQKPLWQCFCELSKRGSTRNSGNAPNLEVEASLSR